MSVELWIYLAIIVYVFVICTIFRTFFVIDDNKKPMKRIEVLFATVIAAIPYFDVLVAIFFSFIFVIGIVDDEVKYDEQPFRWKKLNDYLMN